MIIQNGDGTTTVEGKIVEVRDGAKKISRTNTYGYRSLRVLVDNEYYSVLVSTSKINQYGFLPKIGQWIQATGRLSTRTDEFYDLSLSHVTRLKHIDPPSKKNQE